MPSEPLLAVPARRHRSPDHPRRLRARVQPWHPGCCFQGLGPLVGWTRRVGTQPQSHRPSATNNRMLWKQLVPRLAEPSAGFVLPAWLRLLHHVHDVQDRLQATDQDRYPELGIVDRLLVHRHGHRRGEEKVFCLRRRFRDFCLSFSSSESSSGAASAQTSATAPGCLSNPIRRHEFARWRVAYFLGQVTSPNLLSRSKFLWLTETLLSPQFQIRIKLIKIDSVDSKV